MNIYTRKEDIIKIFCVTSGEMVVASFFRNSILCFNVQSKRCHNTESNEKLRTMWNNSFKLTGSKKEIKEKQLHNWSMSTRFWFFAINQHFNQMDIYIYVLFTLMIPSVSDFIEILKLINSVRYIAIKLLREKTWSRCSTSLLIDFNTSSILFYNNTHGHIVLSLCTHESSIYLQFICPNKRKWNARISCK